MVYIVYTQFTHGCLVTWTAAEFFLLRPKKRLATELAERGPRRRKKWTALMMTRLSHFFVETKETPNRSIYPVKFSKEGNAY